MSGLVVDLFSGAGGWAEGARQLGLDPVGIELDPWAAATHHAAGGRTIRADVASYPVEHLAGRVTGLIASPPCQSFSRAGKRRGLDDERGQLVWEPLRWAEAIRPEWVALEQVPDVLPIWRATRNRLEALGYSAWCGILNAADYGVPQVRLRAVLMASRVAQAIPPRPSHAEYPAVDFDGDQPKPWVTMGQALSWDAPVRLRSANVGRAFDKTLLRPLTQPAMTITFGHNAARVAWVHHRPATTVQGDPRIGRPGHKARDQGEGQFDQDAVRVTVTEAVILQGFPPSYPWQGPRTAQYRQVGNAIPPRLAFRVLGALATMPASIPTEPTGEVAA